MTRTSTVPLVGLMLGLTVVVLADPLIAQNLLLIPLSMVIAGVSTYALSSGVNRVPGASPRPLATLTVVVLMAAAIAGTVAMVSQAFFDHLLAMALAPFILFRIVVAAVDLITPSFTVSLLAGLTGAASFAAFVPLVANGHPDLPIWTCVGIGAALGFVEGFVAGCCIRPLFA
jgi:hypothetical protein